MPAGRPTKYKPEYCTTVYEMLAGGKSFLQFCVAVGVTRSTGYKWAEDHPEFSDAFTRAKEAGEAYWTEKIAAIMLEPSQNVCPPLVKLYMANRFGWSDKQEVKAGVDYRVIPADEADIDADD